MTVATDQPERYRLPGEVAERLGRVRTVSRTRSRFRLLWDWRTEPDSIEPALAALDGLPPHAVVPADYEIPWLVGLHRQYSTLDGWPSFEENIETLGRFPGLEHLYLFHRDGRLREAALDRIHGPIRSSFFFAAVALRLNDWARPVRAAASRCAERCFPGTPTETIAEAALFLLLQRRRWGRWAETEAAPLDRALARTDTIGARPAQPGARPAQCCGRR